jgi:hypothetical protein
MSSGFDTVFGELKNHGLLLQIDGHLPNVCAIVAGSPVRGSWWAHPRSHEIFRISCALADHPDVLVAKLISGKVTYVDRGLWAVVVAIGQARQPWQLDRLSPPARALLKKIDRAPVNTDKRVSGAASELEHVLLVHSEEVHTAGGAHARRLETWDEWLRRPGSLVAGVSPDHAKLKLKKLVLSLNDRFHGEGRLPWEAAS